MKPHPCAGKALPLDNCPIPWVHSDALRCLCHNIDERCSGCKACPDKCRGCDG